MNPEQLSTLTALTIKGSTTREIGQVIGVSHVTVATQQKKPAIKEQVEAGIRQLVQRGLKPAINTLCRAAAIGNTKSIVSTPDLLKISVDASHKILSHVSGSGPQTIINQLIYSSGTHDDLSSDSLAMIDKVLGLQHDDDVIDLSPGDIGDTVGGTTESKKDK